MSAGGSSRGVERVLSAGALDACTWRECGAQIVELAGELDLATIGAAEGALLHANATAAEVIVLDLRGLTFIDCSGLRVIVDAHHRSAGRLLIVRGSRRIQRVFEVCDLPDVLRFVDDRTHLDQIAPRTTIATHREDAASPPSDSRRVRVARRVGQAALAAAVRDLRSPRRLRPVR